METSQNLIDDHVPRSDRERDRRIAGFALPALGALAAEPLYRLVDTAMVGHLGTIHLAGLAIAVQLIGSAYWLFNFLTYGTTTRIAHLHGSGDRDGVAEMAGQALWLAGAAGLVVAVLGQLAADPLIALMGGDGAVAAKAETYLRIAVLGAPFILIVLAGEGYLRGMQDLTTPLRILIVSNVANALLQALFIYVLDMDIAGSAWSTLIAQAGAACAFAVILVRAAGHRPRVHWQRMRSLVTIGVHLLVRTAAILLFFNFTIAVLARESTVGVAANQVILELLLFLALTLDSLAVAAQVSIGADLGSGRLGEVRAMAHRVLRWSFLTGCVIAAVLIGGANAIPRAFTSDPAVLHEIARAWPVFALMQPFNAVVFAYDGILFGTGDSRFQMWGMVVAAALAAPVALVLIAGLGGFAALGIVGAWIATCVMNGVRLIAAFARLRGDAWIRPHMARLPA